MLKKENKQVEPAMDVKSLGTDMYSYNNSLLYNYSGYMEAYTAIRMYETVFPVADAIDKITNPASNVIPVLKDNGNIEKEHDLLSLLNLPNANQTWQEFFHTLANYYLVTGNAFIVATGAISKAPNELVIIPPQYVTLLRNKGKQYADEIMVNACNQAFNIKETFYRDEKSKRLRYYSRDKTKEIWLIQDIDLSKQDLWGKSCLASVFYEIEQYRNASLHNLSLLTKGVRAPLILKSNQNMTKDQETKFKQALNEYYAGSVNAGNVLFISGGMELVSSDTSTTDMDFAELDKSLQIKIYNRLNVPLPLVISDRMTMSNYKEAKVALYDGAVLPLVSRILNELTLFLAPRYRLTTNQYLTYSTDNISALRLRAMQELELLGSVNIATVNEMRAMIGLERLTGDGGDKLYQNQTLVPFARDRYTEDQEDEPEDITKSYNEFIEIMSKQIDNKGNTMYSMDELDEIWNKKK